MKKLNITDYQFAGSILSDILKFAECSRYGCFSRNSWASFWTVMSYMRAASWLAFRRFSASWMLDEDSVEISEISSRKENSRLFQAGGRLDQNPFEELNAQDCAKNKEIILQMGLFCFEKCTFKDISWCSCLTKRLVIYFSHSSER